LAEKRKAIRSTKGRKSHLYEVSDEYIAFLQGKPEIGGAFHENAYCLSDQFEVPHISLLRINVATSMPDS
jgi:hypothetical protein